MATTTLFHTTAHAELILRQGFVDASHHYGFRSTHLRGVFLAAMPTSDHAGATRDDVLSVVLPMEMDLAEFAIVEQGNPVWQWCVPASLVNASASVRVLTDAEVHEIRIVGG